LKPGGSHGIVDQLVLDIKALMLLKQSDQSIQLRLQSAVLETRDEDIQRFLKLIQRKRESNKRASFFVALGELILASLLAIAGLVTLAPAVVGFGSPQQIITYFSDILSFVSQREPSGVLIVFIEFVFALGLLLSSFYSLRLAATSLKEADLISDST